ncbi:menaquinone-dependent protoporphyrinogen oxidase [Halobacillus alkaliphilus]|uniref:Menaquinone-dependent protoporphyrinogen oxidase n=1 Tax=Halobacillus alkaliphilus TaxID=396056 RepID=A0A1I2L1P4_9BACI|nr:flavodoxin domain-containing protein [Halobacillus alkaliphilus]SFF73252.1 menaquinone-dependent protoporphyrinogen oxidase [Halobacillus alkaliphilus]
MKTLIVYGTKHGSARKVAYRLHDKLPGDVQVRSVTKESIPSLQDFDTIILGGSIYMGKIQKELRQFAEEKEAELLQKKLALYICAGEPDPSLRVQELKDNFPEKLYDHAVVKEVAGHEIHMDQLNLLEKSILRMKGVKNSSSQLSGEIIDHTAEKLAEPH